MGYIVNPTPEGDYLAWKDMQWKLNGEASIETVDEKEPCMGHPPFNLYPEVYSSMKSCKHLCGNMGSRSPEIVTLQQWTKLQKVLEERLNNIRGPSWIWMSLNDTEAEGKWVDDYDGKQVNFHFLGQSGNPMEEKVKIVLLSTRTLETCSIFLAEKVGIKAVCAKEILPCTSDLEVSVQTLLYVTPSSSQ